MSAQLKIPVTPADSAEAAVRDSDIIVTATTATKPVLEGRWLRPGMHVNAIGVNFPQKRELDAEAIRKCDVIVADSREQSKLESGDLLQMYADDERRWTTVLQFKDVVSGATPGRVNAGQITLFKSNGIATEDVAVAGKIYEIAKKRGMGKEIALWEKTARAGEARAV